MGRASFPIESRIQINQPHILRPMADTREPKIGTVEILITNPIQVCKGLYSTDTMYTDMNLVESTRVSLPFTLSGHLGNIFTFKV